MINVATESRLSREAVLDKAERTFGPDGFGLEVTHRSDCCLRFEAMAGFVELTLKASEKDRRTHVEIVGREYEPQIKEFLKRL